MSLIQEENQSANCANALQWLNKSDLIDECMKWLARSRCCGKNCAGRFVQLDPSFPPLSSRASRQGGRGDVAHGEGAHRGGGWQCRHVEQLWLFDLLLHHPLHLLLLKGGGEDADEREEKQDRSEQHVGHWSWWPSLQTSYRPGTEPDWRSF